jgi:hypothetical protein
MQYTIRGIPPAVDAALRRKARRTGKSLNEIAVETLTEGAGLSAVPRKRRHLRDLAGTWKEDPAFDRAVAEQDVIDEDLWK